MDNVLQLHERGTHRRDYPALSDTDITVVAAICNRLARMLGTLDRDGLYTDLEIVQTFRPVDLAALAAAPDRVFIEEITHVIEATDRSRHTLRDDFMSRYTVARQTA